jgi:hypothetical protein
MKTKQKIRDSRDANDEQASAQHTLNKKTKHEVDESVAESFVVRSSERAARLFASARSLPFRSVLFMQKHRRFVHCFFFFFFLSLFLSFWGRKKKKPPTPFCYYCTRSAVRWIQPQDRCFTEIICTPKLEP